MEKKDVNMVKSASIFTQEFAFSLPRETSAIEKIVPSITQHRDRSKISREKEILTEEIPAMITSLQLQVTNQLIATRMFQLRKIKR